MDGILKAIGLGESYGGGQVTITGKDPVLASRHRFGEVMAAAPAAFGVGLAAIWKQQTGDGQDVTTDVTLAVHQHHGIHFMRQNGVKLPFVDDPSVFSLTKEFYPTRDGRFVKLETFYPQLRDAAFTVLRCAPTVRAIEAAIMGWDAEDLEQRIREYAGAIAVVRTAEEWRRHPVGRRLAEKPVVEVVKIADSEPIPLPVGGELPLNGLKVLDLTHVIGGPMTARNLAEFGAEVLHVSRFDQPDHMNWRMETDNGKRAAYCDLGVDAGTRRFDFEGEWANFRGTIDGPFGEITYLPSQISMPYIEPRFRRGPQPLGSACLEWPAEPEPGSTSRRGPTSAGDGDRGGTSARRDDTRTSGDWWNHAGRGSGPGDGTHP